MTIVASQAEAEFQRAVDLHAQSRLDEARIHYERVLQLEPDHVPALAFLAVIAVQNNDPDRAIGLTERAIQLDPHNAAAHLSQGHALMQRRRPAAAVASFDKVIALSPGFATGHLNRGLAL